MPAKNIVKVFNENGFYHIYNRGVEKRYIFLDGQDYAVFLSYLKSYLSPQDEIEKVFPSRKLKNFTDDIDLLCYCLMPNHFHFLVRQYNRVAITGFVRSILTRYSMYFNRKYERVGSLFQGTYKAVEIRSEEQLVYLTRYIHRNPNPDTSGSNPEVDGYRYSSLGNFLGKIRQRWVKPDVILDLFSRSNSSLSYRSFVFDTEIDTSGFDLEVG